MVWCFVSKVVSGCVREAALLSVSAALAAGLLGDFCIRLFHLEIVDLVFQTGRGRAAWSGEDRAAWTEGPGGARSGPGGLCGLLEDVRGAAWSARPVHACGRPRENQ